MKPIFISSVNGKKKLSTAVLFKKVKLHKYDFSSLVSKHMNPMSFNDIIVENCTVHLMKTRKIKELL